MSPQSDKTVVEQVCINRKRCRRLIGAITYPVHGPPNSEPSQPAGKVTRSSNQQKPPEFVPGVALASRYAAATKVCSYSPPPQQERLRRPSNLPRLAVSASNRSQSYPSIGSRCIQRSQPAVGTRKKTCPGEGCSGHQPQEINKSRS